MKVTNNTAYQMRPIDVKKQRNRKNRKIKKAIIWGASATGMLLGLRAVGKMQKIKIFTLEGYKKISYDNPITMTTIASASLVGGVSSGILLDKKHTKSKLREASQQMIGNIIFPIFSVTCGNNLFDSVKDKIKMPQLSGDKGFAKAFNHASKNLPQVFVTTALLGIGLFVGNKVANFINNFIFERRENRKLRFSDLSGHVDDVCLATTLVARGTNLGEKIARFIPPALIVPGYVAGTKR